MEYAYTSKRIGATVVDYTLVFAFTAFYITIAGTRDEMGTYHVSGLSCLAILAFWFVYFVVNEKYMGGTLGHHIFKLKVVSLERGEVTFRQIFLRRICDCLEISSVFGLTAYLLVENTDLNQRLGDLVAKTRVIGQGDVWTAFS